MKHSYIFKSINPETIRLLLSNYLSTNEFEYFKKNLKSEILTCNRSKYKANNT